MYGKSEHAKGGLPSSEGYPSRRKKGGSANDYILGFNPDRYLHCRSRRIVLYDLREKKIAAHYCNSERLLIKQLIKLLG